MRTILDPDNKLSDEEWEEFVEFVEVSSDRLIGRNKMTHIEKFTESYKKFYDSYYQYMERIYKEQDGHIEFSEEDTIWVVEKLKDDPCRNILFQCQNDITVEIFQKLESKYSK